MLLHGSMKECCTNPTVKKKAVNVTQIPFDPHNIEPSVFPLTHYLLGDAHGTVRNYPIQGITY